jgi:hypothetical protein
MKAGLTRPLTLLLARVLSFWQSFQRSAGLLRALVRVGTPALKKAGLLEEPSKAGVLDLVYRLYVVLAFVVVVLIPTYEEEPFIYFPAVLALSGAWLLTMPLYAAGLSGAAFSRLRPSKGAWRAFTAALEEERIVIPPDALGQEVEAAMDKFLPEAVPAVAPLAVLKMLRLLAIRAAFVGVIGIVGILAGPALARVHWWRGWSPVAVLYGVSAPLAVMLLMSLLLPFILQSFLTGLEVDAALEAASPKEQPAVANVPERSPRPSRSTRARSRSNGDSKTSPSRTAADAIARRPPSS